MGFFILAYLVTKQLPIFLTLCLAAYVIAVLINYRNKKKKAELAAAPIDEAPKEYDIYNVEIDRDNLVKKQIQKKRERKKLALNATDITFAIGILLMLVAEAVLVTSSWNRMGDALKIILLSGTAIFVFGASLLAKKVFELNTTSFALYSLATLLLPIIWLGISGTASVQSVSRNLAVIWNNYAISALLVTVAAYIGYKIFKSQVYLGITYMAFTWLVLFMSYHATQELSSGLFSLALLALISNIAIRFTKDKIKSLYIYTYIVSIAATGTALMLIRQEEHLLIISIGTAVTAVALSLFSKIRFEAMYVFPFIAIISLWEFLRVYDGEPFSPYLKLGVILLLAVLTVTYRVVKLDSLVSEIVNALALFVMYFHCYSLTPKLYLQANLALLLIFVLMFFGSLTVKNKAEQIVMMIIAGVTVVILSVTSPDILKTFQEADSIAIWKENIVRMAVGLFCYLVCVITMVILKKTNLIRLRSFLWIVGGYIQILSVFAVAMSETSTVLSTFLTIGYILSGGILIFATEYIFFRKSDEEQKGVSEIAMIFTYISSLIVLYIDIVIFVDDRRIENVFFPILYIALIIVICLFNLKKNTSLLGQKLDLTCFKKGFDKVLYYGLYVFFCAEYLWCNSALNYTGILVIAVVLVIPALVLLVISEISHAGLISFFNMAIYASAISKCLRSISLEENAKSLISAAVILFMVGLWNIVARVLYKQMAQEKKVVDFLSLGTLFFAFTAYNAGSHMESVFFCVVGIVLLNTLHRASESVGRALATVGSVAIAISIILEIRVLPDYYIVEAILVVLVALAFVIRFVVKPLKDSILPWVTFWTVCFCMFVEFWHAFVTASLLALILLGIVSLGIFVVSFIKREKRWFVQGAAELITMAVYMGISYWGSFAWWIYLLIAGIVTLSLATSNEIKKKKAAEKGEEAKKIFGDWTW